MSISNITVNGNTVPLVAMPTSPALESVEFSTFDAVAIVSSPFTMQTQAQQWPGADMWGGTMTLPPLTKAQAGPWIAFLMQLRGMANAFLLGDPLYAAPAGVAGSPSNPTVTGTNAAGAQSVTTTGWVASTASQLLPGDHIQIGYRLHVVLDTVASDSSGNATIDIWPALRESPAAGTPVHVANAQGLFRLATNKRGWSADYTKFSRLSFQVMEYR